MKRVRTGIVHVHTSYSNDCDDSLEELREFCLARGISWVALTDHAEDLTPAIFSEYLSRCAAVSDDRVNLIPGLEYRFAGFPGLHLLALGMSRWMEPKTPAEFILGARAAARMTIAAHPILFDYRLPDSVRQGIDAIEVWNATYNTRFLPDPRAVRMLLAERVRRPEIVGTVGLDQHDRRNDRETRVLIAADEPDALAALKAGRFTNRGKTMSFDSAVSLGPARLAGLTLARWLLDKAERVQHHVFSALATRRPMGG